MEEDDIRSWHKKPTSRGDDQKSTVLQESFKKCWNVGAHMIKQFDEQESEESEEEEEAPVQGRPVPTTRSPAPEKTAAAEEESSEEEDGASGEEEDDDEESGEGTGEESE